MGGNLNDFDELNRAAAAALQEKEKKAGAPKKRSFFLGVLGALGGALLGAFALTIMGQSRYYLRDFFAGLVAAFLPLLCYEKARGRMDVPGVLTGLAGTALAVYLGTCAEFTVDALPGSYDLGTALEVFTHMLGLGWSEKMGYGEHLALVGLIALAAYLVLAVGALRRKGKS